MAFTDRSDIINFEFWKEDTFLDENWGIGVHDLDGNGYLDFFANHHSGGPSEIIFNFASGAPRSVLFDPAGDTHSVTFFDVDQDGDTDLLQGVGGRRGAAVDPTDERLWNKVHLNSGGGLSEANSVGLFGFAYGPSSGRLLVPVNFDGQIAVYAGVFNRRADGTYKGEFFARNDSGGYDPFSPVGDAVSGEVATGVHFGGDRFVDIINLDRFQRKLTVFENDGSGFEPGVRLATDATDVVAGDFDGDLDNDILAGFSGRKESLFLRGANGAWIDVGATAIGDRPKKSWTILTPGDFDNDGDLDYAALQRGAGVDVFTYLNRGDGTFQVGARFQDATIPGRAEYMISGDFNRDGALDLIINTSSGDSYTAGVYTHLQGAAPAQNNWLSIELRGTASETGGLGARVFVTTPDGEVRMLEQDSGAHFAAQDSTDLHFGLARNTKADVRIVWPDGYEQRIAGLAVNRHVVLTENRDGARDIVGTSGDNSLTGTARGERMFGLEGADLLTGLAGADALYGGRGADRLLAGDDGDVLDGGEDNDRLRGQEGGDTLIGGLGADILFGGTGKDLFRFFAVAESPPGARDSLQAGDGGAAFDLPGAGDGDRIDLSGLDGDATVANRQDFRFGGTTQKGTGFIWLANSTESTILRGNTDADATAEFEVEIRDGASIVAARYEVADFIL